jgi:2-oxopent-4-enoate/cis-2-oxohex-4-enoate hydratase
VTAADVLAATECVMPCFEIVDSRIRDWKIKIQDTVADNASCGVFVLGDRGVARAGSTWPPAAWCSRRTARCQHRRRRRGRWAPGQRVAWLANTLGALGIPLKAGEVILSGSLARWCRCRPATACA